MGNGNKISIIIPAYNVEKYIGACIETVKKQTCREFECVIVDDGSTDRTLEVIYDCIGQDSRFQIYQQENLGVSQARNVAMEHASGDYLLFLDADDLLKSNAVELVKTDTQNNSPDILLYPAVSYYEEQQVDGSIVTSVKVRNWHIERKTYSGCEALGVCLSEPHFWFAVWQTVVSLKYVQENSYKFKRGIVHEDELWLMRVIGNADKVQVGSGTYYMNRGRRIGGITQSHDIQKELDRCTVIRELQRDVKENEARKEYVVSLKEKCAELELTTILNYSMYAKDDNDKALLGEIKRNRGALCGVKRIKYRMIWLASYIIRIRTLSEMLCHIRR